MHPIRLFTNLAFVSFCIIVMKKQKNTNRIEGKYISYLEIYCKSMSFWCKIFFSTYYLQHNSQFVNSRLRSSFIYNGIIFIVTFVGNDHIGWGSSSSICLVLIKRFFHWNSSVIVVNSTANHKMQFWAPQLWYHRKLYSVTNNLYC